jgi:hypothetical protein
VIAACLKRVVSPDVDLIDPPLAVQIPDSSNPGEVDFAAALGVKALLVGEAKAYFVARRHGTVINSFHDQVGKAAGQLRLRLDALIGGRPLTSAGQHAGPVGVDRRPLGIAVPLHSYATAVWNGEALNEAGALHDDISVIPIHQLILVAQCMKDADDWARYLNLRNRAIQRGWQIQDEADMLVAYIGGATELQSSLDSPPELNTAVILQSFYISLMPGLSLAAPSDRMLWRSLFARVCQRN